MTRDAIYFVRSYSSAGQCVFGRRSAKVRRCRHIFFLNAYVIAGQHALMHRLISRVSEYLPVSVKSPELK